MSNASPSMKKITKHILYTIFGYRAVQFTIIAENNIGQKNTKKNGYETIQHKKLNMKKQAFLRNVLTLNQVIYSGLSNPRTT